MIEDLAAPPPADGAWQQYTAAERDAQRAYLAAVQEAQRNFDADVKPAIDTYHSAERAAWQHYIITSRAVKRRYLETIQAAGNGPSNPPLAPLAASPAPPDAVFRSAPGGPPRFIPAPGGNE